MRSRILLVAIAVMLMTACAGTAVRKEGTDVQATAGVLKIKAVQTRMSDKAKAQLPDNIKFDMGAMSSTIERALSASGLEDPNSAGTLDVEVTNVYVRGTFSAVMFGFLAGVDNIAGNVRVIDANGNVLRRFETSASYAFGGAGGGQDGIRLNYLYEKFAELTRDQLRDQK